MPTMNMIQAVNSAMAVMLHQDPKVVVFGEDVGYFGGVFRATEGLQRTFGKHRCFDTPISEGGIVGAAIGMGAYGLRPVVEIQFADYIYPAFDQLVSEALASDIAPPQISRRRSRCDHPTAAASSAVRPTVKALRVCLLTWRG